MRCSRILSFFSLIFNVPSPCILYSNTQYKLFSAKNQCLIKNRKEKVVKGRYVNWFLADYCRLRMTP